MPQSAKIRILVVDDIADTRDSIKRMIQFDPNIEVIGYARSGQEAIDQTVKLKPDVIIMDINMPDMDGITATETILKKVPFAKVVFLSVQSNTNYMRRAMAVGARDFLSKPPNIDELIGAIQRAGKLALEERAKFEQQKSAVAGGTASLAGYGVDGKVIVVYSPKGGSGTTMTAVNLALALQSPQRKCVIVDANLQFGDVAVFINEQCKNSLLDLTPIVDELDPEIVQDVMTVHQASGVSILAAPIHPEITVKASSEQVTKLLKYLKKLYSYVIVDTTPFLTDAVQGALEACDLILLIATQEIPTIKNCHLFLNIVDSVGIPRENILLVINKFNKLVAISPEKIGENLKQEVILSIPLDERTASYSINRGIPFFIENKTLPISKSIQTLAEKVIEVCTKQGEPVEDKKAVKR
jgi:pilus assembly protein CpaE